MYYSYLSVFRQTCGVSKNVKKNTQKTHTHTWYLEANWTTNLSIIIFTGFSPSIYGFIPTFTIVCLLLFCLLIFFYFFCLCFWMAQSWILPLQMHHVFIRWPITSITSWILLPKVSQKKSKLKSWNNFAIFRLQSRVLVAQQGARMTR